MDDEREYWEIYLSWDYDVQVGLEVIKHRFSMVETRSQDRRLGNLDKREPWGLCSALLTLRGVYECAGFESVSAEACARASVFGVSFEEHGMNNQKISTPT